MNRVLAAQVLVPLVCTRLPPIFISLVAVSEIASISYEMQATMSLMLQVEPVVNAMVTLTVIRPYRRMLLSAVCGKWGWKRDERVQVMPAEAISTVATQHQVGDG